MLARQAFPKHWRVHLFLPTSRSYSGDEELAFFREHTPIPAAEVQEILAAIYHGIVPAFAEADLGTLRRAMHEIHCAGFKKREVESHGSVVRDLLDRLYGEPSLAAGMSSLGPLVYAIAPRDLNILSTHRIGASLSTPVEYLGSFAGRNEGYELEAH